MKKILLIIAVTGLLAGSGCKKDRPELELPGSKLEGIASTWELVEVIQVDIASIQQKKLNVSEAFIGSKAMKISFNSVAFTYSVEPGIGPNYLGNSGIWAFDNNQYPTIITLTTDSGEKKVLPLVKTIRSVDQFLNFSYSRKCTNDVNPYVAYEFKFVRSN